MEGKQMWFSGLEPKMPPKETGGRVVGSEEDYMDLDELAKSRISDLELDSDAETDNELEKNKTSNLPTVTDNDPYADNKEDANQIVAARIARGSRNPARPKPQTLLPKKKSA